MESVGTNSDQLSNKRRAYLHHFHFPVKKTQLKNPEVRNEEEDGGYVVNANVKIEWNYYPFVINHARYIGYIDERHEYPSRRVAWHERGGDWICPKGNSHIALGVPPGVNSIFGDYSGSGIKIPMTRKTLAGVFSPPPFSPALQAALLVGQSSYPDYGVLPTAFNINPISDEASRWVTRAEPRIREAYDKGMATIYHQTGVFLASPVAEVDSAQLLLLMKEKNIAIPTGMTEDDFLSAVGDLISEERREYRSDRPCLLNGLGIRGSISPNPIPVSLPLGIDESYIPEMDVFVDLAEDAGFKFELGMITQVRTVAIPKGMSGRHVGWGSASASVRDWMARVSVAAPEGGLLTLCEFDSPIVSTDIRLWEKDTGDEVTREHRRRSTSVWLVHGIPNRSHGRFLNGEALRLLHAGTRFPVTDPGILPLVPVIRTGNRDSNWIPPLPIIRSDRYGAPTVRDGHITMHPYYDTFPLVDTMTLVFQVMPFRFPKGSRVSPGSVYHDDPREIIHDDEYIGEFRYPEKEDYTEAVTVDPEYCDRRDDAFIVNEVGEEPDTFRVDVFSLSVASHMDLRTVLPDLPNFTIYRGRRVTSMLPRSPVGLSTARASFCHHHVLHVSKGGVIYRYAGIKGVRLKAAHSYQGAWMRRKTRDISLALRASKLLMQHRDGLRATTVMHNESSLWSGFPSVARENGTHEMIAEFSLAVGSHLGHLLPVRVATTKDDVGPYVTRMEDRLSAKFGEGWKRDMSLLPPHWRAVMRDLYIRHGGRKFFTWEEKSHMHAARTTSYGRVCSPARQKDCLINDMFLCRQISREEAWVHIPSLNAGVDEERNARREDDDMKVDGRAPLGAMAVVSVSAKFGVRLFSLCLQVDVNIPLGFCSVTSQGAGCIKFHVDRSREGSCWVGIGDVVYFSGDVVGREAVRIRLVRKLWDVRDE